MKLCFNIRETSVQNFPVICMKIILKITKNLPAFQGRFHTEIYMIFRGNFILKCTVIFREDFILKSALFSAEISY